MEVRTKAAVLYEPFQVGIEERDVPALSPDEVLVKVKAVGVCGSDVHYYQHGKIGRYVVEKPLILGHECAGIVAAVGKRVNRFAVGDRVAIEPGVACGTCAHCKAGMYNLCSDVQFMATPPVDGAFSQYVVHRQDFVYPIPDTLSFEAAAMAEPFSVGLHASMKVGLKPGQRVAVMGMGPVGLLTVAAAKAFGVTEIYVSDVEEKRLAKALEMGATHVLCADRENVPERIRELTGGIGVDVAFETAGNPHALQAALFSLSRGGNLSVIGLPVKREAGMDIPFIVDNEIRIQGVFRYANTYPLAIQLLSNGTVSVESLFTGKYPLEQAGEALERARTDKSNSVKVMVYPNGF